MKTTRFINLGGTCRPHKRPGKRALNERRKRAMDRLYTQLHINGPAKDAVAQFNESQIHKQIVTLKSRIW